MPGTHPPYPLEYRRRIIELAQAGRKIEELAREFEPSAIRKWIQTDNARESLRSDELTATEREVQPGASRKLLEQLDSPPAAVVSMHRSSTAHRRIAH